ncbi:hypothetical protein [Paludibacterium purpuratum]|uniref:Uncharacterized protein n=1 Tax=Paludibacterium purpuratum TaxID=1144873 RepID=A0A4R7B5W0_9NEIS|nr:hypothetical protein [Paludibacterium purpuratum]TDR79991.1 hypothetical protein DFP86_106131 [Paludibacterium purpuratum]
MDRQIVYPGQILPETTLLQMSKDAMLGLSKLSAAVLGSNTLINGFAVAPTSPASLQVNVAPGEIYSLQNVDSTAFSTLGADTAHQIVKQGMALDASALTLAAPTVSGQSANYLIQIGYQDSDSNATMLPYYNSANPAQQFAGQGNNSQAQNTVRKGVALVQAKAGTAASTGTQTTPAPDSGFAGAYVVTVAYGQTQITAANIAIYPAAPFFATLPNAVSRDAPTGSAQLPAGNSAQRTSAPAGPAVRFNTDTNQFEGFYPNAMNWGNIGGGATGGGNDQIFELNGQVVTTNYSIPANSNAQSAGPISINNGVTVTIPSGSVWVVN